MFVCYESDVLMNKITGELVNNYIMKCAACFFYSYVFAKTTVTGLTTFYGLRLSSTQQRAFFEYRPEGLEQGSRTLTLDGINLADGELHHLAVTVYGRDFALFLDGRLHQSPIRLVGVLEDGPGILYIGRKLNSPTRFSGTSFPAVLYVHES